MSKYIIELQNISFSYISENSQILKKLALQLKKGEITTILGPNGIGKTTLLRIILGWNKVNSGSVLIKGRNLRDYSRKDMGKILALVPQDEHIAFEYSLLEYVLLGRSPHLNALASPDKHDYSVAMSALDRVGLSDAAYKSVQHLSGGEKQLVLVARSLAQEPEILLLDEPMSNLDLSNKIKIIEILKSLKKEGVTILFTSHEPDVAAYISDYLILMGNDFEMEQGDSYTVFTDEILSRIYGTPIQIKEIDGRKVVFWH